MGDTEAIMVKEKEAMVGENGAVVSPEEIKPVKKLDADKIYRIIGSTGIKVFIILMGLRCWNQAGIYSFGISFKLFCSV